MLLTYRTVPILFKASSRHFTLRELVRTTDDRRLFQQLRRRSVPVNRAKHDFIMLKSVANTYECFEERLRRR